MRELALDEDYYVTPDIEGVYRQGELVHIARNAAGGSWCTPVGRYFASRPDIGAEGHHPHWRLDCFIRDDPLAPDAERLARTVADRLIAHGAIAEPVWIAWHRSEELGGDNRGDVFDSD